MKQGVNAFSCSHGASEISMFCERANLTPISMLALRQASYVTMRQSSDVGVSADLRRSCPSPAAMGGGARGGGGGRGVGEGAGGGFGVPSEQLCWCRRSMSSCVSDGQTFFRKVPQSVSAQAGSLQSSKPSRSWSPVPSHEW